MNFVDSLIYTDTQIASLSRLWHMSASKTTCPRVCLHTMQRLSRCRYTSVFIPNLRLSRVVANLCVCDYLGCSLCAGLSDTCLVLGGPLLDHVTLSNRHTFQFSICLCRCMRLSAYASCSLYYVAFKVQGSALQTTKCLQPTQNRKIGVRKTCTNHPPFFRPVGASKHELTKLHFFVFLKRFSRAFSASCHKLPHEFRRWVVHECSFLDFFQDIVGIFLFFMHLLLLLFVVNLWRLCSQANVTCNTASFQACFLWLYAGQKQHSDDHEFSMSHVGVIMFRADCILHWLHQVPIQKQSS